MKLFMRSFVGIVLVILFIIPITQVKSQSSGNYFQPPVTNYQIYQTSTTDCHFASKNCADKTKYHTAIDLSSGINARVLASASGYIALIQQNNVCNKSISGSCSDHGMGKTVIIEHTLSTGEKIYSMYSHLDSITAGLSVGQCVKSGSDIGIVGGSGYGIAKYWPTHLHCEIKTGKTLGDPKYNTQFGYTSTSDPTTLGYKNPEKYINNRSITVQDCGEVSQFIQGLQKGDATTISSLASSGLSYAYQIEGVQSVTALQFKDDLNKRLNSHPSCDGVWLSSGDIWVFTSRWTPTWTITKLCYESCEVLKTPFTSAQVGFRFRKYGSKYQLDRVWLGDPKPLSPGVDLTLTSCSAYSQSITTSSYPTSTAPSPTSTPSNCSKSPVPHLKVGEYAIVSSYSTLNNNVRQEALMTSYVYGVLKPGATMKILEGPKCSGGYYWWKVSATSSQLTGWTVEGDQKNYWLLPCSTLSQCKP